VLTSEVRRLLSLAMTERVLGAVSAAGARPVVLAADSQVMEWAGERGWDAIADREPSLNAAAAGAVEVANRLGMPWMVVHADLPLLSCEDVRVVMKTLQGEQWVLAPSSDGGTSLIGGRGDPGFDFAYGEASFHRHLSRLRHKSFQVLYRLGFVLDLDHPSDLKAVLSHPRGGWLARYMEEL
jgi:2-phospho-L-lactate guanylyltransferase